MEVNSYIYLYHLDKFVILPDYPESVTDSLQSQFTETNALARTAPVFAYKYSGPRTISTVSLQLHRDMMETLNRNVSNLKENVVDFSGEDYVDTLIKYLQAASLPKYNEYASGSKTVIPPMIAVRFGNDIFIKGVINSAVQITYKKPILYNDKYAVVDVGFNISEVDPYDADTVLQQGSFRGFTRTFKDGIYADSPTSSAMIETATQTMTTEKIKSATIKTLDKVNKPPKKTTSMRTTASIPFKIPSTGVDGPPPGGANTYYDLNNGGNDVVVSPKGVVYRDTTRLIY